MILHWKQFWFQINNRPHRKDAAVGEESQVLRNRQIKKKEEKAKYIEQISIDLYGIVSHNALLYTISIGLSLLPSPIFSSFHCSS